jgi:polyhydroxybutyrate depolymerase
LTTVLAALALLAADPERLEWTVAGVVREGLVHAPAKPGDGPPPALLAFHGHGGSMQNAARSFRLHEEMPEAVVVYPQGLPTPGRLTDPEGRKSGWQAAPGDQGDRDLAFVDAILETLRTRFQIDPRRLYAMGHSNGGAFTYLLWGARPDLWAAIAPSGAVASRNLRGARPLPVLHLAGRRDALVKFEWQERTLEALRRHNGCEGEGAPWEKVCIRYPSSGGSPLTAYVHGGGHAYPKEGPALVAAFFREQVRPER